jgi:endonuclease/exonuclease/phosphatase family metal-dependent hydrolase
VELLVRSWNVFHGNAVPPERHAYLEESMRLAVADRPDVLLLQELPVWALSRLGGWTGMDVAADVAARPVLPPEVGRVVTDLHHGVLRSALTGQANAMLFRSGIAVADRQMIVLNERRFRRSEARRLGLPLVDRLAWARERRVCQWARVSLSDGKSLAVAHFHATAWPRNQRLADAELLRAAVFADALARPDEPLALGGDFNVRLGASTSLDELTGAEWGFAHFGSGVDHFLVRGAELLGGTVWPDERRRVRGRLLSDHTPKEIRLNLG